MDTVQIKGLDDVNRLLGQLSSEDLEERTPVWRTLRGALFAEPVEEHRFQEIGKGLIQEIEAAHEGSLKEGESALRHWVESQPSFEARVGALRVLGRFAGTEKKVWQEVVMALATDDQSDVDLRAWALYTLHWARLELTKKNWGDVGQRLIDHCLNAPQAKVRQWAALALGEMATYSRPEKARKERTRLADSYTRIAVETALIQRWGCEIDLYVARQLIISLGKAGGHVHKSIEGRTTWPVIQLLEEAAGDDRYEVRREVPYTIERVAETLLAALDVPAEEKAGALKALLKILGLWFERPGGDYETYRDAITAIAGVVSLVLNNATGQVLLETQTQVTEAGLQLLFSIAESQEMKEEEAVRDRALRAVQYSTKAAPGSARQLVAALAVPQLQCMLADPSTAIAGQAIEALITLSGEEPAADFFADVILQDTWAAKAVSHRAAVWGLEEGADVEALERLVRRRAALAIGRIGRNQTAHDHLVESLKQQEGITYQRANEALKAMGGQKAVQALIESTKQQWVESKFFNPIEEADQHGRRILNATVWMSVISYLVTLGAAVVVLWFGAGLLSSSVQKIQASGTAQLATTVEAIAGAIAAIAGLLLPFFWNPSGAVQKANAEMTKLVTAFHGYMGRMRLLGLGFAHAYTEDRADTNFLLAISHAAGDAMVDSAGVLTDVGAWPGVNKGVVQVPDFKGMTWSEAAEAAKGRSLQITMKEQAYDAEIEEGKVTAQSLPAETLVELGATLALTLSKGKHPEEPVTLSRVPVFANKGWEEAEQLARENALTLTFDQIAYSPLIAENRVVSQDPKAGMEVAPGTLVRLTVSKGPEPMPEVVVPQLVGMSWDTAQTEAGRMKLSLTARHIYSEQAEGIVVDQTPTAEVVVHPETPIALLVSKGPAPNAQAAPTFIAMTWDKALI
ncbi:MAG: PASTA domain-containing protein, partial [Anaerolineae bacterium]|nr:PASTA domain-containing protein [Anaerolineae bacterium]